MMMMRKEEPEILIVFIDLVVPPTFSLKPVRIYATQVEKSGQVRLISVNSLSKNVTKISQTIFFSIHTKVKVSSSLTNTPLSCFTYTTATLPQTFSSLCCRPFLQFFKTLLLFLLPGLLSSSSLTIILKNGRRNRDYVQQGEMKCICLFLQ